MRVLVLQPPLLERGRDDVAQLVELERLGDEIGGAALDDVDRVLDRRVAGDDDGDDAGIALEGGVDHLAAVDARQAQIGDDDVEGKPLQLLERRLARTGLDHREALVHEPFGDHPPQRVLIVHEENICLAINHLHELSRS